MNKIIYNSNKETDTISFAKKIAKYLSIGDIVFLTGDLGSGKTTFTKGVAEHFKFDATEVHSPTFVLMNEYKAKVPLYHFDLYRLSGIDDLESIGFEDFFYGEDGISLVEWAQKLEELAPDEYLEVNIKYVDQKTRKITVSAVGKKYQNIILKLKEKIK